MQIRKFKKKPYTTLKTVPTEKSSISVRSRVKNYVTRTASSAPEY